jgi:hypothetical protein
VCTKDPVVAMLQMRRLDWFIFLVLTSVSIALRWSRWELQPLYDFDSVMHYQWASGNPEAGQDLFYHAAPLFNLLLQLLYWMDSNPVWHLAVLSVGAAIGVKLLMDIILPHDMPWWRKGLWYALALSSLSFSFSSSMYSVDAFSLLPLALTFFYLKKWIERYQTSQITRACLFLLVTIFINYKAIIWIPILFFGLWRLKVPAPHWRSWFRILLPSIALTLLIIVLGMVWGSPWWRYPQHLAYITFASKDHPYLEQSLFQPDLLFYVKYWIDYENPLTFLLLCAAALSLWFNRSQFKGAAKMDVRFQALVLFIGYFLVIALIQKAPRALLPLIPMAYALMAATLHKVSSKVLIPLLILAIGVNIRHLSLYYWPYYDNATERVANVLQKRYPNKETINTNAGKAIWGYALQNGLTENFNVKCHLEIPKSPQGIWLLDGNAHVARLVYEPMLAPVMEIPTMQYGAAWYWLEHAEYNGFTYEESVRLSKSIGPKLSYRLYEMNSPSNNAPN